MYLPVNTLWVLVVGKLLIFLIQQLPPAKVLAKREYDGSIVSYFGKLLECSLCLGEWVYFILCCVFKVALGPYVPVVSELITAAIFSFVVYLLSQGWKVLWGVWE